MTISDDAIEAMLTPFRGSAEFLEAPRASQTPEAPQMRDIEVPHLNAVCAFIEASLRYVPPEGSSPHPGAGGSGMTVLGGPWVVGGAVLAALTGGESSDIDVLFKSRSQVNAVLSGCWRAGFEDVTSTEAAGKGDSGGVHDDGGSPFDPGIVYTFRTPWGLLNIAALLLWEGPDEAMGHFDFSVCQCVYVAPGVIAASAETFADVDARRLRFRCETSTARVQKYLAKGFQLDADDAKVYGGEGAKIGGADNPGKWRAVGAGLTPRLRQVEQARREAEIARNLDWTP